MTEEKLVPELRFQEFEDNWEKKKLGEILKVKYGQSQKEVEDSSGKYPILGTGGIIGYTNEYLYDKESVLIGRKGTIDEPVYINKPFWTIDTLFYTEIDFENNNAYWIYSSFLNVNWYKYNEASGVPSLNITNIENIKIKIPSKKEQNKIGDFFSSIDKKIELQEQLIENLEEQKKGLMQKIFNQEVRFKDENGKDYPEWEEKKLGEIAIISYGYTPSTKDNENFGGKYTWYGVVDLRSKMINNSKRTLSEKSYREDKLIPAGTLLMSFKLTIGELSITEVDCFTNEAIANFIWKENINTNFMYYKLMGINIEKYGNRAAQGITLNSTSLNSIIINLPIEKEQEKIANFLSSIDKKIELEKEKLEEYEKFKKGLMQRMFI